MLEALVYLVDLEGKHFISMDERLGTRQTFYNILALQHLFHHFPWALEMSLLELSPYSIHQHGISCTILTAVINWKIDLRKFSKFLQVFGRCCSLAIDLSNSMTDGLIFKRG